MSESLYILSSKSNSYIGYYTGNVVSLIKNEWEGLDVEVELFYRHTKAKELVEVLRKYFINIGTYCDTNGRDIYGFWVKKLRRDELDSILLTFKHVLPKKEEPVSREPNIPIQIPPKKDITSLIESLFDLAAEEDNYIERLMVEYSRPKIYISSKPSEYMNYYRNK